MNVDRCRHRYSYRHSLLDLLVQPTTEPRADGVLEAAVKLRHLAGHDALGYVLPCIVKPQRLRATNKQKRHGKR